MRGLCSAGLETNEYGAMAGRYWQG